MALAQNTAQPAPDFHAYNRAHSSLNWQPWSTSPADLKKFLFTKDPTLSDTIRQGKFVDFVVKDLDMDGKNDVILSFWGQNDCTDQGCAFAIYFGDPKKNLSGEFIARSVEASRGSLVVDEKVFPLSGRRLDSSNIPDFRSINNKMVNRLIEEEWRRDPEYKQYVQLFHSVPEHRIALIDLNQDGTQEIMALHRDQSLIFCNKENGTCRLHLYSFTDGHLKEIGRFMSTPTILLDRDPYSKYAMIKVENGDMISTYVWNGHSYEQEDKDHDTE